MNKFLLLSLLIIITGCSVKPIHYDLSTIEMYPPIETKQNIPSIKFANFKYEPAIGISPNTISFMGCFQCKSDGGTAGFVYSTPINNIVQAEIKNAFQEVMIPTADSTCKLGATIHMVSWNILNGNSIVDMTFNLRKENDIKYLKRFRGLHKNGLFESEKQERFLANASRKTASLLVTNETFLKEVNNSCSKEG